MSARPASLLATRRGKLLLLCLDGYYSYEAPDLAAAIAFGARIPVARMGGTVEIRAMVER